MRTQNSAAPINPRLTKTLLAQAATGSQPDKGQKNSQKQVPVTPVREPASSIPAAPAAGNDAAVVNDEVAKLFNYDNNATLPDLQAGTPQEVWGKYFTHHRPAPRLLSDWVSKLHQEKKYPQVIACLQAAILHGQSQPWMYEVLALNMEIEKYPKEAIERVVLSLTDFGTVDFGSMMYSGAYLTRFGRKNAALNLYRQAARMLPERPEPYLLGLKLARDVGTSEDLEWAATGILLNYWKPDFAEKHKVAETALMNQIQKLRREQNNETAERLQTALREAKSRDLMIRLEWNGSADLDMQIEEPTGSVCSFDQPETQAGGLFLHDGFGPNSSSTYELYVCPRGVAGPYRIRVRNAQGSLVGNRATLTVTLLEGLPDQTRFVRTLVLEGEETALTIELPRGRRTQARTISQRNAEFDVPVQVVGTGGQINKPRDPRQAEVEQQFQESRGVPRRAGAVGYTPIVNTIQEGTGMSAQAIISPDRRYIRLGIQPVFNDVTDVFTFTYLNGGNQ